MIDDCVSLVFSLVTDGGGGGGGNGGGGGGGGGGSGNGGGGRDGATYIPMKSSEEVWWVVARTRPSFTTTQGTRAVVPSARTQLTSSRCVTK